jgi:hypothetical protein
MVFTWAADNIGANKHGRNLTFERQTAPPQRLVRMLLGRRKKTQSLPK